MDYIAFSRHYFNATGIPVNLLENGKPVYSSLGEMLSFLPDTTWKVYAPSHNPEFCSLSPDLEYGHVRIEGTGYDLFIGPVFTTPVTDETIQMLLMEQQVPSDYREQLSELLQGIPVCSHPQCLRALSFLHLCLNSKEVNPEDFYREDIDERTERSRRELSTAIESMENEAQHSSYAFETQLYHHIEMGDTGRLKAFLESVREFPREGRMARNPLRHAKNILIGAGSKAVVLGAIPGGMDEEKAYQLLELYSMECEQMQTIEDVHRLQYIMMMDLCQRTGNARMPKDLSSEIYRCVTYIRNHVNGPLSIDEIAAQISRSRSWLMRRFKAEMGIQVNAYITRCKMEEACNMLSYSSASLADISAYLGYSSQSYFQNVFKKAYELTPMQYRKKNSRLK
ncbi:MAG: helix-turn-helix domain-containing protein [Christensenellales bacterium]|jgi:AraC-like DNA-binding protein